MIHLKCKSRENHDLIINLLPFKKHLSENIFFRYFPNLTDTFFLKDKIPDSKSNRNLEIHFQIRIFLEMNFQATALFSIQFFSLLAT